MNTNPNIFFEKEFELNEQSVAMEMVFLNGEEYYKIANHNKMRPFFMSIVSDSNHWLFYIQ